MRAGWIISAAIAIGAIVVAVLYQQGQQSSTEGPVVTLPESTTGTTFVWLYEPRPMPPLHFVEGSGRAATLADFHGRTILLNIWATWCLPCRHEIPTLDRLQAKLGSRDFEVVTLSVDRGGVAAVQAFFREINVQALRIYVDPSSDATGALGLSGLPTTLLVDPDGREIGRRIGPANWDGLEMVRAIRARLAAR
jgi:thiol-disulfide isomerase/thioredoxin